MEQPEQPGRRISLAYSVDADDAFMFHALRVDRIDTGGFWFTHRRGDTAELNRLAASEGADVVAVSAAAYPEIADRYQLLPHGASIGRGYGPLLVAARSLPVSELAGRRVAVPGLSTTAWLTLSLLAPSVVPVVVPIVPHARVFEVLAAGEVDAALLIHEGRLVYEKHGLHKILDVGEWWQTETGLPLPLGVNVIRRGLGPETVGAVSGVLRESIHHALEHRDEVMREMVEDAGGSDTDDELRMLDVYLSLYANRDTLDLPEDGRRGLEELYRRALSAGFYSKEGPSTVALDFTP